jgi:hypothetical protein
MDRKKPSFAERIPSLKLGAGGDMVSRVHNFHALVETMHCHGRLLRKSLHVVETVKRGMLHFHCLVVPVGLAHLWIPAFAGMTMKAKAAGMGGSSENPLFAIQQRPGIDPA